MDTTLDDLMGDWEAEHKAEMARNEARRNAWLQTPDGIAWKAAFDKRQANTPIEEAKEPETVCGDCGEDLDDGECPVCKE